MFLKYCEILCVDFKRFCTDYKILLIFKYKKSNIVDFSMQKKISKFNLLSEKKKPINLYIEELK